MPKAVRMADIAAQVGVSIVTVSKALSGKDGVSEILRSRIQALAVEMGYMTPSAKAAKSMKTAAGAEAARNVSGGLHAPGGGFGTDAAAEPPGAPAKAGRSARGAVSGSIGVLIPQQFLHRDTSFYWHMYTQLVTRFHADGYFTVLEVIKPEDEQVPALPRVMRGGKIDGVVVIGQVQKAFGALLCSGKKTPVVFLDSYDAERPGDSVISDGFHGMYFLTGHLISAGHTDIAFLGSVGATSSISDRYFGFRRAMCEHGLEMRPGMVIPDRDDSGIVRVSVPGRLPTAFACNCDLAAYDLMVELRARGLRVPADVSVVGFDDYAGNYANLTGWPGLTTYAVDTEAMACACAEKILHKIRGPLEDAGGLDGSGGSGGAAQMSGLQVVSGAVVWRDSVAKPRALD
ncbi:MAG: LacI family DNA-binding transcriptional regulator [Clostridiales bacterium]|jgi:DNA-binding LacI/PurR family transcriptional regulator|nr:LacI family DNA-binding transcriptional regulator [Clostridiales bacterium]